MRSDAARAACTCSASDFGLGSAALGALADHRGINYVFQVCAFLPLLGLLTAFLPDPHRKKST